MWSDTAVLPFKCFITLSISYLEVNPINLLLLSLEYLLRYFFVYTVHYR